jgi:membrane-associated phospholipid phosphatase
MTRSPLLLVRLSLLLNAAAIPVFTSPALADCPLSARPCSSIAVAASPVDRPERTHADSAVEAQHRASLFRPRDAAIGLGVVAAAIATMSADESLARSFRRSSVQSNTSLRGTASVFNNLGFPGSEILIAGTYFYGLGTHSRPVAALGMHTGEAVVAGGILSEGLQRLIGRARPLRDINNAHDFKLGKGLSDPDYTSLPSTHVTAAFAAATAASHEVRRSWPGAAKFVTPISYAAATLVGLSRMYSNKHWASDVVASAGLGTYTAVVFERYNDSRPGNVFERIFLPASVVPQRRGVAIAWSIIR